MPHKLKNLALYSLGSKEKAGERMINLFPYIDGWMASSSSATSGGGEGRHVGLVDVASGSQPLMTGQEEAATVGARSLWGEDPRVSNLKKLEGLSKSSSPPERKPVLTFALI